MIRILAAISLSILASACATTPQPTANADRPGLAPRAITAGDCGLFVWKVDAAKTFTYFASEASAAFYDGAELQLEPTENYLSPNQLITTQAREWTLRLSEPSTVPSGIRYSSGTLTTQDTIADSEEKWDIVVPVVGLNTCGDRPKSSDASSAES